MDRGELSLSPVFPHHLGGRGGGGTKDHVQQLLLTFIHFTMAFSIENRSTWLQHTLLYFKLFLSCMQSTSYILVETVLRSGVFMATETGASKRLRGSTTRP